MEREVGGGIGIGNTCKAMAVSFQCMTKFTTNKKKFIKKKLKKKKKEMELSRQEYWSGLPFLSPGDLPNPGIELGSPALQAWSWDTAGEGSN